MSKLFVLCGGEHGRVVIDTLLCLGLTVDGIIDEKLPIGSQVFDIKVVGNDAWLLQQDVTSMRLVNGLGVSSYHLDARRSLFEHYIRNHFTFVSMHHPSVTQGRDVRLAEGAQILAGVQLQCGVSIGRNVVVNTRATLDHDCQVMDHCFIGPGAILCGDVQLHQSVFIGAGAVILPGITIGAHAVVGAGAVVTKPVANGTCVYGNPATPGRMKSVD